MITKTRAFVLVLCLAPAAHSFAQEAARWGKVPKEQLEMDSFPADSNAAAVILSDYGEVSFNPDFSVAFERHTRIKILTEAGYEWGTVSVPYDGSRDGQHVTGVRGQTFVLGDDGKAVRHKMGKDAIFKEDIDGTYERIKFTLPNLAPGAVIEYRYKIQSENPIFLPGWTFQSGEPTLWSEYRYDIPDALHYVRAERGGPQYFINTSDQLSWNASGGITRHRLVMRDVPALRKEPYMTAAVNYRASIEFQLAGYYDPLVGERKYLQTWDELARTVLDGGWLGTSIDDPGKVASAQVMALTNGIDDPLARMEAIYDHVRTTIVWDGKKGSGAHQKLKDVYEQKSGDSGEIALLLIAMLRTAGLQADPVLISTRSNGKVIPLYPILSQFDGLLAAVQIGKDRYLLDATNPNRPYDLLPYEALNGAGWLVKPGSATWIPIESDADYSRNVLVMATLDEAGALEGSFESTDHAYSALEKRGSTKGKDDDELLRDLFLNGLAEPTLQSAAIEHQDEVGEDLVARADFSVPAYAQAAGDFLYVNPIVVDRHTDNPLRLPERTFPVDYGYCQDITHTLSMTLPAGYQVVDQPKNVRIQISSKAAVYQRLTQVTGNTVTMRTRFIVGQRVIGPEYYQELRRFYDQVVSAEAEQLVLKRSDIDAESGSEGGN